MSRTFPERRLTTEECRCLHIRDLVGAGVFAAGHATFGTLAWPDSIVSGQARVPKVACPAAKTPAPTRSLMCKQRHSSVVNRRSGNVRDICVQCLKSHFIWLSS